MSAEAVLGLTQLLSAAIRAGVGIIELRNKMREVEARGGSVLEVTDWIRTRAHENLARLDEDLRKAGY